MSLENQERTLFTLLFDAELRAAFVADPRAALAGLDLSEDEQADFLVIRPEALELDAALRRDLMLQQLAVRLPLSFSLLSSVVRGLDAARELVDISHVLTPPAERALGFARRLRDVFEDARVSGEERDPWMAIVDAEIGLLAVSTSRRRDHAAAVESQPVASDRAVASDRPLTLAAHVAAAVLPRGYDALLSDLCPGSRDELWARLAQKPLTPAARRLVLTDGEPVVLLARAVCTRRSRCEATVDLRRIELAGGFAPLLARLDGETSLNSLLDSLRRAGAPAKIVAGVRDGFTQLVRDGYLEAILPGG